MTGRLFYVIGASGAGKNRIMREARKKINGKYHVVFAHRYITRETVPLGENHVYLTKNEFKLRLSKGFFTMKWETYDNFYGIGEEVNIWLSKGTNVVVNGSREYMETALKKYPSMKIILITASYENLKKRLLERNREDEHEIEMRLARADKFSVEHPNMVVIHNNDINIKNSVEEFIGVLTANGNDEL